MEYLVHFPTLLRLTERLGFEMIEMMNFQEFYEDHRNNHVRSLIDCGVIENAKHKKSLHPDQFDLIGNSLCSHDVLPSLWNLFLLTFLHFGMARLEDNIHIQEIFNLLSGHSL